jgi:hypothetical protein
VTAGTGLLLLAACAAQAAGVGRFVNAGAGFTLCLLGLGFYRLHRRFIQREIGPSQGEQGTLPVSGEAKTDVAC